MITALVSYRRPWHWKGARASPGAGEAALALDRHLTRTAQPRTSALLGKKGLGTGKAEYLAQSPKAK